MKDLNFFEPYVDRKDFKFSKELSLILCLSLALIGVLIYGIYNQISITKTRNTVNQLKLIAEDPKVVEKVRVIKKDENDVLQFKQEVEDIRDMNNKIRETDFINEEFINSIISKMPEEIFLTSYRLGTKEINISGISKYKVSVAEFKKGLESIEKIEDIFISHIIKEEENYKFDISCVLEEVILDDEENNDEGEEEQENL